MTPKSFQGHAREVPSYNQTDHNYEEEEITRVLHQGAALPYYGQMTPPLPLTCNQRHGGGTFCLQDKPKELISMKQAFLPRLVLL